MFFSLRRGLCQLKKLIRRNGNIEKPTMAGSLIKGYKEGRHIATQDYWNLIFPGVLEIFSQGAKNQIKNRRHLISDPF